MNKYMWRQTKLTAGFHVSRRVKSRRIEFTDAVSHHNWLWWGEWIWLQYWYIKVLCVLQKYLIFFLFIKSAAYFPSDMSFLCPNIKTKKQSTERRLNPCNDRPTSPKIRSWYQKKKSSWNPETKHSNKHLYCSLLYRMVYIGSSIHFNI